MTTPRPPVPSPLNSRFITECDLRVYRGNRLPNEWVVLAPLVFEYVVPPVSPTAPAARATARFVVPPGFVTDLASIPRAVRLLPGFDVNGRSRAPAVLHDWLYCSQAVSRSLADYLFHVALRAEGVPPVTADLFWAGVRLGGWVYYNRRESGIVHGYDFVPEHWRRELAVQAGLPPEFTLQTDPYIVRRED